MFFMLTENFLTFFKFLPSLARACYDVQAAAVAAAVVAAGRNENGYGVYKRNEFSFVFQVAEKARERKSSQIMSTEGEDGKGAERRKFFVWEERVAKCRMENGNTIKEEEREKSFFCNTNRQNK
jgi:hypothetical protein